MSTPATETARAALHRHGLPEDVIDGALALHAQELADMQRADAQARHDRSYSDNRVFELKGARIAADLIDPARAGTTAPAVVEPPADRAAGLREAIAVLVRRATSLGILASSDYSEEARAVQELLGAVNELRHRLTADSKQPAAPAVQAVLSPSERQFLTFALDEAADQMACRDGFTDEDHAALASLRRLTADAPAAELQQDEAANTDTLDTPRREPHPTPADVLAAQEILARFQGRDSGQSATERQDGVQL